MKLWQFELNESEDLVIDQKPHWSYLLAPIVHICLLLVFTGLAIIYLPSFPWWVIFFPLSLILIVLMRLIMRFAGYQSSHLIVTTERLVDMRGIISRRVKEVPLDQIANLSSTQRFIERLIGSGSLAVEHSGEHSAETFIYVRRPDRVKRLISAQISRRSSLLAERGRSSALDELSKLAELRRTGNISQEEYESVKSRLLNQI